MHCLASALSCFYFAYTWPNSTGIYFLQLVLDDMKLLGWLKCTECANAAKKARK